MLSNDVLILRLVSEVKAFAGFTPQNARDLLGYTTRIDVEPGTPVLIEDEPGREFYIVMHGTFLVVKKLPSGKKKIIAKLVPGDTFGEMSFLDGRPRAASVIAESDGLLLRFEHKHLIKIPEVAAKIYFNLAGLMASRIRSTNTLISLALEKNSVESAHEVPADALKTHRNFRYSNT